MIGMDAGVAFTFDELTQRAEAFLEVRLDRIPNPARDLLQNRDSLRQQPPGLELSPAVANPCLEFELGSLERLDMSVVDADVAFTLDELGQRAEAFLEVRLERIPNPARDLLQNRDPLRRQPPDLEIIPAAAGPRSEVELGTLERFPMALRDAGVAFTFDELGQGAVQPPPEVRRGAFEDGQLELVEVVDAEDPEVCRFKEFSVGDWSEGGEAAEPVEFSVEAEVVGLQRT